MSGPGPVCAEIGLHCLWGLAGKFGHHALDDVDLTDARIGIHGDGAGPAEGAGKPAAAMPVSCSSDTGMTLIGFRTRRWRCSTSSAVSASRSGHVVAGTAFLR